MVTLIIGLLVVILDQVSKYFTRINLSVGENFDIIKGFFKLTHFENKGAAFSSMTGETLILIGVPIIVLIIGVFYIIKNRKDIHIINALSIGLILGGDIGNLIDRIKFASVTDMFSFEIFPAIFNVADIAIVTGGFLLVFYVLFENKLKERNSKSNKSK